MKRELKNKVVVVTGGANGIGYIICDKYLEQGAKITIIVDVDEDQGKKAAKLLAAKHGERARFIHCDVTTDLDRVFKIIKDAYTHVDVLVQSAGIEADTIPKKLIDINLTSIIEWSLKFQEIMKPDPGHDNDGTNILISSICGFRTIPYLPIYQASKFGVVGFAKAMGHIRNFKKTGVRIVALCPGLTNTDMTDKFMQNPEKSEADFINHFNGQLWQDVDTVGDAAVEVFNRAETGSVWVIEGSELTERITDI